LPAKLTDPGGLFVFCLDTMGNAVVLNVTG
jgi:hypothetical protein